jgi:hypothetical protein
LEIAAFSFLTIMSSNLLPDQEPAFISRSYSLVFLHNLKVQIKFQEVSHPEPKTPTPRHNVSGQKPVDVSKYNVQLVVSLNLSIVST